MGLCWDGKTCHMPASSVPNARNLVEGERCKIVTRGQEPIEQRFAESIVIPTSATIYILYILRNTLRAR